ncbi:MAG: tRNA (guanosine(46)-N7)-methyltransferase TrmB [Acutalibacteraceae bacterium]
MRRKKNLEPRLEKCSEYLIEIEEEKLEYGTEPQKHLIDIAAVFKNNNPLVLEIGCGKGQFACEIAKRNPDINYIAVEINRSVIVQACEKAKNAKLGNLKFLNLGAEKLDLYIPEKSVEHIYLNFSCPFPKKRQAKHRLTHKNFLEIYKRVLKDGGAIFQKTDNMHFFEFSIEEFSKCGFVLSNISLDLHASGIEDNIITEYEKRFSDLGQPIYRLEAHLCGK